MYTVGIVNVQPTIDKIKYVTDAIEKLGYTYDIYHLSNNTSEIYTIVKNSNIKKWIFTGSSNNVLDDNSPVVPIQLLDLPNKEFMFICYSMESIMHQLNFGLHKRIENKKEFFQLVLNIYKIKLMNKDYIFKDLKLPLDLWRNHHYYIENTNLDVASYNNESMMLFIKNSILVQFHPERTEDGHILIRNWVEN